MTDHQIVPALPEHAFQLAPRLRAEDLAEIKAASGQDPEALLLLSIGMAPKSWAWLYRGEVMAIFGAGEHPYRQGVGIPWLLAADGVENHKHFFVRNSKRYIAELLEEFPYLENYVDCRNTPSIQWLAWCGFTLAEVEPFYGAQRLPFIRFCKAR